MKLTENEVIDKLSNHLVKKGWTIKAKRKNFERGIDIEAFKGRQFLAIEAKGAKANSDAHNRTRKHFSANQIKTHFGVAIVKVLSIKSQNPTWQVAIALPDDDLIRKHIDHLIPFLRSLQISMYWVSENGSVINI